MQIARCHIWLYREKYKDGRTRERSPLDPRKKEKEDEHGTCDEDNQVAKKAGKEIRRARDDARITSRERKASARLRYIKYNYSDSKKRAQVETYDNMVHGGLRARAI